MQEMSTTLVLTSAYGKIHLILHLNHAVCVRVCVLARGGGWWDFI